MEKRYATRIPCGKTPHPNRAAAAKQMAAVLRRNNRGGMNVYFCQGCDAWHIGHLIFRNRKRV